MKQLTDKPIDECTLEELEALGFEGPDTSLEISLAEYGLLCAYNEEDQDWFCIVGYKKDRGFYDRFYTGYIDEQELYEIARDQGKASFWSYVGAAPWIWRRSDVIRKISDLKSYLGPENVFGSPNFDGEVFQMMALLEEA